MASDTETETAKAFTCRDCEDTHTVRITFTGANGAIVREVPCPMCGPDAKVTHSASVDYVDSRIDATDKRLGLLVGLAVLAAVMAAFAYIKATGGGNPFAEALKEAAE